MARKRTLTPEEENLWHSVTRGVVPIDEKAQTSPLDAGHQKNKSPLNKAAKLPSARSEPGAPRRQGLKSQPDLPVRSGSAPHPQSLTNLDRKEKQRVRRGTVEVDAKIDLHGFRQSEAHQALIRRVSGARRDGKRVLLVVTGKGQSNKSRDDAAPFWAPGGGVLRQQVPIWLGQEPLRSMVFSVQQAHQRHGGSGALYVFLKKLR